MRAFITAVSFLFFAASVFVTALAVTAPERNRAAGTAPPNGSVAEGPAAGEEVLSTPGESESRPAATEAILRLQEEQASYRSLVSELRENIAVLEEELRRSDRGDAVDRLLQEQTAHSEEVRRLRRELSLLQKEIEERAGARGPDAEDPPEPSSKEIPPGAFGAAPGGPASGAVVAVLGGGIFSPGLDAPSKELVAVIQRLLPEIAMSPGSAIVVEGHTDNTPVKKNAAGGFSDNRDLSRLRAENIARLLVGEGIDPARISVAAYGDTRPLAPNDTPDGRAENRRVEIRLVPWEDVGAGKDE